MITVETECSSCSGTGLYSGFGEGKGVAVVCQTCDGTGCAKITYKPFQKRKSKHGIKKVFEKNSGWGLGKESVGGLSYAEWVKGASFFGKEQRDKLCPHWHNQSFRIKGCRDLMIGDVISNCPHFKDKDSCWAEFDLQKGKVK